MTITRSLDLWGLVAVVAAAVVLTLVDGPVALRFPLGFLAIMFAPGYSLVAALFPRAATFDVPERIGVSLATSVAIIAFLALLLSNSPWGLRRDTIALSVGLTVLPLAAIALLRSRDVINGDLPTTMIGREARSWATEQPGQVAIVVGTLVAIVALVTWTLAFNTPPTTTEFGMIGPDGLARGFPRQATVGQPLTVTLNIANREQRPMAYRVEVRDGEQVLTSQDAGTVADAQSKDLQLSFTPTRPADPRTFDILLFTGNEKTPYRSLRLIVPVYPAGVSQP